MDVCLTPEMVPAWSLRRLTVVVADILRASSSITAGMQGGVPAIRPVEQVHRRPYWKDRGYLLGGERHGEQIDGFDLGNAPEDYLRIGQRRQKIIMTTTNGTRAIQAGKSAQNLIVGSFLNLEAVATHLEQHKPPLLIICSGWQGKTSFEDTLFAGALTERLIDHYGGQLGDGALLARATYQRYRHELRTAVQASSHGQRLIKLGREQDISFCLQESIYSVVPILRGEEIVTD